MIWASYPVARAYWCVCPCEVVTFAPLPRENHVTEIAVVYLVELRTVWYLAAFMRALIVSVSSFDAR